MFIGHFGAGFAGKNFEKAALISTYFITAEKEYGGFFVDDVTYVKAINYKR
ncbi:MAG: hypothetical protein Q8M94_18315 [Ignavibacteria bacterium]|nr:hypothetical protein [Ignavibacteria bacterium]